MYPSSISPPPSSLLFPLPLSTGLSGALWNLSPVNTPTYYESAPRDLPSPLPTTRHTRSRSLGSSPQEGMGRAYENGIHQRWHNGRQAFSGVRGGVGEEEGRGIGGGGKGSIISRPHSGISPSSASITSSTSLSPSSDPTQGGLRRVASLPEVSDGDLSSLIPAPPIQIEVGPRSMAAYQEIADHFHALDQEIEDLEVRDWRQG